MRVAFLMRCDNACPLCPALDPTECDRLDSATVAEMMQGEKIMGVSAVCGPAASHSPQDMLNPAFIPFMSTNEKSCMAFALIICMHLPAFTFHLYRYAYSWDESEKKEMFALLIAQHKSISFVNKRKLPDIFAYSCGESFFFPSEGDEA